MKYSHLIVSILSIGFASSFSWAITAFPGALGFGNAATGGRGGTVYHVTNLDDSGMGSFRDAVSKSKRIVVFDVSGYIQLKTAVSISSNITIAGQTAPGEGIGIRGGEISCANQTNIIIRYLRVRPGSETASTEDDALSLYLADNVILDHCSFEFAPWNNIDGVGSSKKLVTNISFLYCLIANPTGQQLGAHCESVNSDWSWYYNAFVNSHNRNPLAKANNAFVNNVLYDNEAGYTTHTSTNFKHDIVNNYFIYGPKSSNNTWYQINKNQSIYYSGNLLDTDKDGTLGGAETTPYWYQGTGTVLTAPWSTVITGNPIYSTKTAFRLVTSQTGDLPYDDVDSLIWSQVNSLGKTGTLYTTQASTGLANNGYGVINGGTKPTDTDGDGGSFRFHGHDRYGIGAIHCMHERRFLRPAERSPGGACGGLRGSGHVRRERFPGRSFRRSYFRGCDGAQPPQSRAYEFVAIQYLHQSGWIHKKIRPFCI